MVVPGEELAAVAYSVDGRRVAATTKVASPVRIYESETGKVLTTLPSSYAPAVAISPDKRYLVTGGGYGMQIWTDLEAPEPRQEASFTSRDHLSVLRFSPRGTYLAAATSHSIELLERWKTRPVSGGQV